MPPDNPGTGVGSGAPSRYREGVGGKGPLAGTRVLSLIDGLGAYAPKLMVGLGADVVLVEPDGGSTARGRAPLWQPAPDAAPVSLPFMHDHAGMRSVTVDPTRPEGRVRLERLLDRADVVFDNGQLARWGFDLAALAERMPPLVVVSVTPFGLDGYRSAWLGPDLVVQAMSGTLGFYGYRDERPARWGAEQSSQMSGLVAAYGALVARFHARRSGEGDRIDVAAEQAMALPTFQMQNASMYHQFGFTKERAPRGDSLPNGIYEVADGFVTATLFRRPGEAVAMLEAIPGAYASADELRRVLESIAPAPAAADPRPHAIVQGAVRGLTRAAFVELIQSHGALGLAVNDARDLVEDPFLRARDAFVAVEPPAGGPPLTDAGPPIRFGRTPFVPGRRAPMVGEHRDELEAELAAHAPSEFAPTLARPQDGAAGGPLSGIRVLDLSWIIAGPLAARLLADFGADVIKVESRERPDVGRSNRLYPGLPEEIYSDPDVGGYFHDANAGKRSLTLDLGTDEGRALLERLVAVSDVVICNLAGDQLERWGIGYERARELNPGVIVVNVPTMESRGPRARWRAFGDMFVSVSGLKSISGHPGEPPLGFGHNYADFSSNPFHAAIAALAALDERERSGEGQFIEVSQYEATMGLMGSSLLEYATTGVVPSPRGNEDDVACPHDFYRCAGEESWIAIAVSTDAQWRALVALAGAEALMDPAYATLAGRRAHRAALDAAIESWTVGWDRQALAEALQAAGVPAGPYQLIDEMVHRDPTLGRAYFVEVDHPVGRSFLVHGNAARLRRHPARVTRGPLLGEHSYEVLTGLLGVTPERFAELARRGVV